MNRLPIDKRVKIIQLLLEGCSLRSTSRIVDVSINTVTKLLVDVGRACQDFHNKTMVNINAKRVQCDEIWSFVYAKQKNVAEGTKDKGDVWTFTGIDADSKLIISWLVASRDEESTKIFMRDVAARLNNRVQLTTDGFKCYLEAVDDAFRLAVDYAQLVKKYGTPTRNGKEDKRRQYIGADKRIRSGVPREQFISTSYIERQNLTMRMHIRRFARKTNAFSKKVENHTYAVALYFVYYNFGKIHTSLSITPAMQAGLMKRVMSIEEIVNLAY